MKINGRDVGFRRTVETVEQIAALCPDHDISRLKESLRGDLPNKIRLLIKLMRILNEAEEHARKYETPEYETQPLTDAEILGLSEDGLYKAIEEALKAFNEDAKQTVEIESPKKKKQGTAGNAGGSSGIELNERWLLFYGRRLGMERQEILCTRYGEMLDMIACLAIYDGRAEPKKKKRKLTYDEVMNLR